MISHSSSSHPHFLPHPHPQANSRLPLFAPFDASDVLAVTFTLGGHSTPGSSITQLAPTAALVRELRRQVWLQAPPGTICSIEAYDTMDVNLGPLQLQNISQPRADLVSEDGRSTMVIIRVLDDDTGVSLQKQLRSQLPALLKQLYGPTTPVSFRVTGDDPLWDSVIDSLESDLVLGDLISIPTALLILCATLRSLRHLVVPLASIAISTLVSFTLMVPVAIATHVSTVTPKWVFGGWRRGVYVSSIGSIPFATSSLLMALTTAMSVDYSLFQLSRFREEVCSCSNYILHFSTCHPPPTPPTPKPRSDEATRRTWRSALCCSTPAALCLYPVSPFLPARRG